MFAPLRTPSRFNIQVTETLVNMLRSRLADLLVDRSVISEAVAAIDDILLSGSDALYNLAHLDENVQIMNDMKSQVKLQQEAQNCIVLDAVVSPISLIFTPHLLMTSTGRTPQYEVDPSVFTMSGRIQAQDRR